MLELDDENWLTDLAFLVNLTAHLNELNIHLQGENQLISIMFQTISVFQMKLKLRQTQIKANNFMLFDTLAKHSPMTSKKHAALLSDLIQEFENRFQDFQEDNQYFAMFVTPFSVYINMSPANFQMACLKTFLLQRNVIVCLYWTFTGPVFLETNIPCLTIMPYSCHHYLAALTFESNYFQE